jgi:hypothetical protein
MATYKHLRSSTANKRPTTSITDGQLAINTNTASPGLFFKDSAGTGIVKVGPVHVGTTAPNATPAAGGSSGNYLGEQWLDTSVSPSQMKVWNGSAWVGIVADELPVSKLQDGDARQLLQTDAAGTGVEWTSNVDVPGTLDVTSTATFDSIARHPLGSAAAPTLTFTGDPNTGIYSPGADQVAISTGGTGRLFVAANGRVGIGTASPSGGKLHVEDTTNTKLRIYNADDSVATLDFHNTGSTDRQINVASGEMYFTAGVTEHARITSAGLVGIGTSDPGSYIFNQLVVSATGLDTGLTIASDTDRSGAIAFADGTASAAQKYRGRIEYDHADDSLGINTAATRALTIDSSGRLLVGTSTSVNTLIQAGLQVQSTGGNAYASIGRWVNSTANPGLVFNKSRGGSVGTLGVVQSGDNLGEISFTGDDGSAFVYGARIQASVDGTPGANDMPGRLVFSTTADGASSPTERLRITSAGLVGIGTTSPAAKFHASDSVPGSTAYFRFQNEGTGSGSAAGLQFYSSSSAAARFVSAIVADAEGTASGEGYLSFYTRLSNTVTEKARIDSSGRLLVGTSTASTFGTTTPSLQNTGGSTSGSSIAVYNNATDQNSRSSYIFAKSAGVSGALTSDSAFIGSHRWYGFDGINFIETAAIDCRLDGTPGANDMPGRLVFSTTADGASSPTERMRIASTGNKFHVSTSNAYEFATTQGASTSNTLLAGKHSGIAGSMGSGTASFIVYSNGNVQNTNNSYGAISDAKLKENIVDASSQWDDLKALRVRNYNLKEGQTHTQIGLVAQEVEPISPGLVYESPDRDPDGNDLGTVTKSVNYSVLYMKAVKALQEAMERIETLEGMVAVNNITIDEQQHQLSTLAARLTALESA